MEYEFSLLGTGAGRRVAQEWALNFYSHRMFDISRSWDNSLLSRRQGDRQIAGCLGGKVTRMAQPSPLCQDRLALLSPEKLTIRVLGSNLR
jgi:hypothetical protein